MSEFYKIVEGEVKQAGARLIVIEGRLDGIEVTLKEQGDLLRQILAKVA